MKYKRSNEDLIIRLNDRLLLLKEDAINLRKDVRYAGRVASELRALVIKTRTNHPLLLDIASLYNNKLEYQTNAPPHYPQVSTLEKTLDSTYQIKYGGVYVHTVRDLIKAIADKEGAHEDREFTTEHLELKSEEISIGGYPAYVYQLILVAEIVVYTGGQLLHSIELQSNDL